MGDEIPSQGAVTLQGKFPSRAEIRLIKDGECIKVVQGETFYIYNRRAGRLSVEAYKRYLGVRRGWIFSNSDLYKVASSGLGPPF